MALIDREDEERVWLEGAAGRTRTLSDEVLRKPVRDVRPRAPVTLPASARTEDAVRAMVGAGGGAVLLVDEAGRLVGIFTERDLMRKVVDRAGSLRSPVSDHMTAGVEAVGMYERVGFVLNMMVVGGYRHVPVVDDARRPVGMLSVKDLLKYLVDHFPEDVLNVPPGPNHETKMLRPEGG